MTLFLFGAILSIIAIPVPEEDEDEEWSSSIIPRRRRKLVRILLVFMILNASLLLSAGLMSFDYYLGFKGLQSALKMISSGLCNHSSSA